MPEQTTIQTFDGQIALSVSQQEALTDSLSAILSKAFGYELPILSISEQSKVISTLLSHSAESMQRLNNDIVGLRLSVFMGVTA